jgi:D-tyrosyl-tRNA(Tyr) deacylase
MDMIGLIQRVRWGKVSVSGAEIGVIGPGLVVLVGVERGDGPSQADRLASRLLAYRVFPDEQGRMNLSVVAAGGALLVVPQFTLAADTRHGNRPGFEPAAPPDVGRTLFDRLVAALRSGPIPVETGRFGADMDVELCNAGPVTFSLRVTPDDSP